MKRYRETTTTAHELVSVTCDLCGDDASPALGWHKVDTVDEIRHREGDDIIGEGFMGREIVIDLCPNCFRKRVLPALREMGLRADYEERG